MKKSILFLSVWVISAFSGQARGDAQLRLYNGRFEFDLKRTVTISTDSGHVAVQNYKKVCTGHTGCKAVATGEVSEVERVRDKDLADLNLAIAQFDQTEKWAEGTPKKESICRFYNRFVYQFDPAEKVAEFQDCAGSRSDTAEGATIERVLNIAASNAGL